MIRVLLRAALCAGLALPIACSNNPYPDSDRDAAVLYTTFREAPRTLDPAVAYTTSSHAVTGNVYDTLLEYHYLKRPYTLIPSLAVAVPEGRVLEDGRVAYRFELRRGLLYQDDPAFGLGEDGRLTREIVAEDVAFQLKRIADPAVNSPVIEPFRVLAGFAEFGEALAARRKDDAEFAALPAHEQYAALGPVDGLRVVDRHTLEIVLREPSPQILYWFAMPFTTPVAWEAVQYYDGKEGRPRFADHPVGSGPYRLVHYNKQARMSLEVNPNWHGVRHPEWKAPGTLFPSEGAPGDAEKGLLDAAGEPLPRIQRIEFLREKESIPRFNKFLQGYFDTSGIIKESFDKVVVEDRLSPEMAARGMKLEKSVEPSVFYIGFNMDDPTVGAEGGERSRKLRQAMSLTVDVEEWLRRFTNGRGVPAQSPIPPGLFGYDPDYLNPFRKVDMERARALLKEAGYADGIDPETGKPLHLTFDTYQTSPDQLLVIRFFVDAWRRLGLNVELAPTNYNQFQEKVRNGAYQIYMWGWIADFPDPENFLFLLWSELARSNSGGPNTSNFSNARFDELYKAMKVRPNDAERRAMVAEMRSILEHERPWIELHHSEDYALYHGWLDGVKPFGMSFPMVKYRGLDVAERAARREAWNEPLVWPVWVLLVGLVAAAVPGVVTFYRERQ